MFGHYATTKKDSFVGTVLGGDLLSLSTYKPSIKTNSMFPSCNIAESNLSTYLVGALQSWSGTVMLSQKFSGGHDWMTAWIFKAIMIFIWNRWQGEHDRFWCAISKGCIALLHIQIKIISKYLANRPMWFNRIDCFTSRQISLEYGRLVLLSFGFVGVWTEAVIKMQESGYCQSNSKRTFSQKLIKRSKFCSSKMK